MGELSATKQRLLEKARQGRVTAGSQPIARRVPGVPVPLSFAQEWLWFLNQLASDDSFYNMAAVFRSTEELDVGVLEQSVGEIVRRHEVLRTVFRAEAGVPWQVIRPAGKINLPLVDMRELAENDRESALEHLIQKEIHRPFHLSDGPLWRACIFRIEEKKYVVLVAVHHIAADGWSIGVLFQEIITLYAAYRAGIPSPLPELPMQYGDYALWQREWLQGKVLESELEYWRNQLAGAATLDLPTDSPRAMTQSRKAGTCPVHIDGALHDRVKELSRREGATLFMTLLAAFIVLLYRYADQEDISVGTITANRRRSELEGLIGFFVNPLVLRIDLGGEPSLREVLIRVKEKALEAFKHQDLPFEKLVAELKPVRDFTRNPLFQVMFLLQNTPLPKNPAHALELSSVPVVGGAANFDLLISLNEVERQLKGVVLYPAELYEAVRMERLAGHYQRILEEMVKDEGQAVKAVGILSEAEREQLVRGWNGRRVEHGRAESLQ